MRRSQCLAERVARLSTLLMFVGISLIVIRGDETLAATGAPVASTEVQGGAPDYIIGIGDVLGIHVWKDPDLSKTGVIVRPDGRVSLPLVGDVQAAGLTAPALSTNVIEKLKEFVTNPRVTIIIETINSYRVYIIGQVGKSGVYTFQSPTRLVEALATAGGFTQFADASRIVVLSSHGTGGQTRSQYDFKKIASGDKLEDNIVLRPGDTVIVP